MAKLAPITQNQKADAVHTLYSLLGVNKESENFSAEKWAENSGASVNQIRPIGYQLERLGILERRIAWIGGSGKQSFWTLLVDEDRAQEMLKESDQSNASLIRQQNSLRERILTALREHGAFENVHDIMMYIAQPNESLDLHNMTHVLQSLRQQGKVSFKVTNSGRRGNGKGNRTDNVPHSIALRENGKTRETEPVVNHPVPEPEVMPEPTPIVVATLAEQFPMIQRIVMRQEFLQRAAFLAAEGNEDEIATALLEKAEAALNPLEQEIVNLWNAYQECSNGSSN